LTIYLAVGLLGTSAVVARFTGPRGSLVWLVLTIAPLVTCLGLYIWSREVVRFAPPDPLDLVYTAYFVGVVWLFGTRRGRRLLTRIQFFNDPRFQFDSKLHRAMRPLRPFLKAGPGGPNDETWRQSFVQASERVVEVIEALVPPSPEWAEVRNAYVDVMRDEVSAWRIGPSLAEMYAFRDRGTAIVVRVRELRTSYGLIQDP
jgi:hypothetical protein